MVTVEFTAVVTTDQKGRVHVPVAFDPDEAWGPKTVHRVNGTLNGRRLRAVIERTAGGPAFTLGAAWCRGHSLTTGDEVTVVLGPEGPQRADLDPDVAAAFDAAPEAGAFFDSLAQFYRKGYLRWIGATTRRPDERARRIAEVVDLCRQGLKERPSA